MENKQKITVQSTIDAPVAKVWKLWSNPADIMKWNHASDDWHSPSATNDLRVGGNFAVTMAAKDGSFSFEFGGVYTDVREHEVIGYTMGDGRTVTVKFESVDNATNVIETFEAEDQNSIEMQRGGWQAILDNFKKYAESN